MTYPLVRDLAAEGFPVRLTCGVLGFSAQAFSAWNKNPVTLRDLEDACAINALIDAHGDDPAFGYRFLADELERAGIEIGERRAWRPAFPAETAVHHREERPQRQTTRAAGER